MTDANHWLKFLSAEGVILAQTRVAGDWGIQFDDRDGSYFHFIVEGTAYLDAEGMEPMTLSRGDMVLMPQGSGHRIAHAPDSQVVALKTFLERHDGRFSEEALATNLICGAFGVDRYMLLPALQSLPPVLHLKADSGDDRSPVNETLKQLRSEIENARFGGQMLTRHLLSSLFIYVLREWAESAPAKVNNWFSAMQNPNIAKALARIHEDPSKDWNLETLAKEAGLSRSSFAKHFHDSVGEPPHSYLTRWRLGIASKLLDETNLSITEISSRVGYSSENAFNRAFKQIRGLTPTQERAKKNNA